MSSQADVHGSETRLSVRPNDSVPAPRLYSGALPSALSRASARRVHRSPLVRTLVELEHSKLGGIGLLDPRNQGFCAQLVVAVPRLVDFDECARAVLSAGLGELGHYLGLIVDRFAVVADSSSGVSGSAS